MTNSNHTRLLLLLSTALFAGRDGIAQSADTCTVSGTVYGPLLEPVPNASVTVRTPDWVVVKEGTTDAAGVFQISGLPRTWVYCCATSTGLHVGCDFTQVLSEDRTTYVDIRLFAGATIHGTVRDEQGQPVAGAEVLAAFDHASRWLLKGRQPQAISDAEGKFEVLHVPLGEIAVRASAEGFELGESEIYLRQDSAVDVVLKRGNGRELVVLVEGVPPESMSELRCIVYASRPFPQPAMLLPARLERGSFDKTGQCILRGLPKEPECTLRIEAPGMRCDPQTRRVEAGKDAQVKFRLEASASHPAGGEAEASPSSPDGKPRVPTKVDNPTLRGVLRDEKGKPMGLTKVQLYSDRSGWRELITADDGSFLTDAKFEADDTISFSLGSPDWVLVDKNASDYGFRGSVWREFKPGKVEELVAAAATKIRGRLKAASGEAVAGLQVEIEVDPSGAMPRMFAGSCTSEADGSFRMDGLPPLDGPIWLLVRGLRWAAEAGPVELGRKRLLAGIELKLQKPLDITGSIVDRSGKPIPGARVTLVEAGKGEYATYGGTLVLADADGRFAFRGMKAGAYTLDARVRGLDVVATCKSFDVAKKAIERKLKVTSR